MKQTHMLMSGDWRALDAGARTQTDAPLVAADTGAAAEAEAALLGQSMEQRRQEQRDEQSSQCRGGQAGRAHM